MLSRISDFPEEEIEKIILHDMQMRKARNFEHYFNDVMIVLQKTQRQVYDKRNQKKVVEEFVSSITNLRKDPGSLLFHFEDNLAHVFRGFTIDLRLFYNLLRKMIIIKLNHDKIWTRQFYSANLEQIYVVMKPLQSVLETRAQVISPQPGRKLSKRDRTGIHRPTVARASRRSQ